MQKHEMVYRGRKEIFVNNLIGGIGWSFGAIIGTALLLGALGIIAKNIDFVPIVGSFVSSVVDYVITTSHTVGS